ncbi:glycosyltransferase [bacterium]|nr:glycosyltransferase [bacterium]
MAGRNGESTWEGLERSRTLRLLLEAFERREEIGPARRWLAEQATAISASALAPSKAPEVLGEGSSLAPAAYQLDCLNHLDWGDSSLRSKVMFHLRHLGNLIDPLEPAFKPKVSIVIVVQDGRDVIERTLASAVGQSYRSVEVIVVDDGSSDGTGPLVASLPMNVHLIHQDRRGLPEARLRGFAETTGDFVQFVEAGEELDPLCIEEKSAVWRTMPETRLCLSTSARVSDELACFTPPAWDDPRSMLGDAMLSATSRTPFRLSSALVPRWYLEGLLKRPWPTEGIDVARLSICSSAEGVRVAALPRCLVREFRRQNVSEVDQLSQAIDSDISVMHHLADQPKLYRYLVPLSARVTWMMDKAFDLGVAHHRIEAWDQKVADWESQVGKARGASEGTTAILLDQVLTMLRQKSFSTEDPTRPLLRLWHDRQERLLDRISEVKYVTGSDLRRWLPELPPRAFGELSRPERAALKFGLEQLQVSLVLGVLPIRFRSLERVAADYPGHPYERYWSSAFRLARLVGDETARQVFRQKLVRRGWAWMGKARRAVVAREVMSE